MDTEAGRKFWLIADDYGLSRGVSRAIRMLAEQERLSGVGCMTLFDDWAKSAALLRNVRQPIAIGIHLTLTDFPAVSTGWRLPNLKRLIVDLSRKAIPEEMIVNELDTQMDRFAAEIGAAPAFIDGHQHIHYLGPVRRWLCRRFSSMAPEVRPWIRGAPTLVGAPASIAAKIAFTKVLAARFDTQMEQSGFMVRGPLSGFYDWRSNGRFRETLASLLAKVPDRGVVMCHPGHVDNALRGRDELTGAREEEMAFLSGAEFPALLKAKGVRLMNAG